MVAITLADITASIARVDDADVLVAAQSDRALRIALDMCRPPNWQGTGASSALLYAAKAEALPLAWVPPAAVVRRLDAASTAAERSAVLHDARPTILDACAAIVEECAHPAVAESRTLTDAAVRAVSAGHDAAGMALAVAVSASLAGWAVQPRVMTFSAAADYEVWKSAWSRAPKHEKLSLINAQLTAPWQFPHRVLVAPLHAFLVGFSVAGQEPEHLSRNVVAHAPTPSHMNPLNALKAVMMVTGILRSQHDWANDVDGH